MPISRLLQNLSLKPDEAERLTTAYEQALRSLGVKDRNDPLAEVLAKTIIRVGQSDILDPGEISEIAIKQLGIPSA